MCRQLKEKKATLTANQLLACHFCQIHGFNTSRVPMFTALMLTSILFCIARSWQIAKYERALRLALMVVLRRRYLRGPVNFRREEPDPYVKRWIALYRVGMLVDSRQNLTGDTVPRRLQLSDALVKLIPTGWDSGGRIVHKK